MSKIKIIPKMKNLYLSREKYDKHKGKHTPKRWVTNFYDIKEYKVLDVPYTVLNQPNNIQQIKKPLKEIYKYAKTLYLNEKDVSNEIQTNSNLYRHMIGELKK